MTSTQSTKTQKYPGTCDIDLTVIIAERLADGDSPVTEAYEVPDEFALAEAELADLLDDRAITAGEAIDAGHPHVWVLETGELSEGGRILGIYTEADLARADLAGRIAQLLIDSGEYEVSLATADPALRSLYAEVRCDWVRLGAELVTTQYQVRTVPDGHAVDIAWAAIDSAAPAPPR
jgi:hypothetical protein